MSTYYKLCFLLTFSISQISCNSGSKESIDWIDIIDLQEINDSSPNKNIIFLFDPSCGTCDSLRIEAFGNPNLNLFLNDHFNLAELNVYDKRTVTLANRKWKTIIDLKGYEYHSLATAFTGENKIETPLILFLDENLKLIVPIKKRINDSELELLAHFISEDHYKLGMNIEDFTKGFEYKFTQ